MADDANSKDESVQKPDPVKELKSEFARKTENILELVNAQNQKMEQMVQAMIQSQRQQQQQNPAKEQEDLEQLAMNNPAAFAAKVAENATAKALEAQERLAQQQNERRNQEARILTDLVTDYPELNDKTSDLYQEAIRSYEKLSPSDKNNPMSWKAAIRDAAAELGVVPAKKRKQSGGDDFVSPGSSGGTSSTRGKGSSSISDKTLQFAQLLGRPVDDEDYKKRLQKYAERKNWSRYSK